MSGTLELALKYGEHESTESPGQFFAQSLQVQCHRGDRSPHETDNIRIVAAGQAIQLSSGKMP